MYDYLIVGAGIAGLYTAYTLNKTFPNKKICIIEASNTIGGRLHSINHDNITLDGGAARFNTKQYRVVSLVKELNLNDKTYPISNTINYKSIKPKYDINLEIIFPSINTFIEYLQKIIKKYTISEHELINTTILDIVDFDLEKNKGVKIDNKYKSISEKYPSIKQYLIDIYPYYSELGILNALESIKLFTNEFSDKMKYYCINGGMAQLVELLYIKLKTKKNIKIYKECPLENIVKISNTKNTQELYAKISNTYYNIICGNNTKFNTINIILAIPKNKLLYIDYLTRHKNIYKNINSVQNEPLYRIYAQYPLNVKTGKVWFDGMNKISTNLPLKYIIPINYKKGIIMISYTDSKFANYWSNKVIKSNFENTLNKQLKQLFPNNDIPKAIWFKHCFWVSGAGYWKKGSDSKLILKEMIQPIHNESIYICGENYSSHQAWVEGALETSNLVLSKLGINIIYSNNNSIKNNSNNNKKIITLNNSSNHKNKMNTKKQYSKISSTRKSKKTLKNKNKHKNKKIKPYKRSKSKSKFPKYTLEEVAKHNKKSDAWIVINNKVANITEWIPKHPGGDIIMKGVGKDATHLFNSIGHSSYAKKMFKSYQIGILQL